MSPSEANYRLIGDLVNGDAIDIELNQRARYVFGRDRDCEIKLEDATVSRRHAELAWAEGGFQLADLDSHNGMMVNGLKISRVRLEPGDRIEIGESHFKLHGPTPAGTNRAVDRIRCQHCGRSFDLDLTECPGCGATAP